MFVFLLSLVNFIAHYVPVSQFNFVILHFILHFTEMYNVPIPRLSGINPLKQV